MGYSKKKRIEELANIEIDKKIWEYNLENYVEGDPDSSVLVLEFFYRFLYAKGCRYIVLLMNYSANMCVDTISNKTSIENFVYLSGNDSTVIFADNVKINIMEKLESINIKLRYKDGRVYGNRSGYLFMYKGKWHALEVDTLLGPKNRYDYGSKKNEEYSWIFHTLGNFGLIPYGAGSPGGNKKTKNSQVDIVKEKVENRFGNYPSGFSSADDINSLMNYSEMVNITENSTIEQVKKTIINRGKEVYELLFPKNIK